MSPEAAFLLRGVISVAVLLTLCVPAVFGYSRDMAEHALSVEGNSSLDRHARIGCSYCTRCTKMQ